MGPIQRLVTLVFLLTSVFLLTCSISVFAMQSAAGKASVDDSAAGRAIADRPSASRATMPRVMRFSGGLGGADGSPRTGVVALTFTLYNEAQGGSPGWVETQNVTLDDHGRYTATLGAASGDGLPVALFAKGEARWLGVRVAEEEGGRGE